jgi:hypothetical protein
MRESLPLNALVDERLGLLATVEIRGARIAEHWSPLAGTDPGKSLCYPLLVN